MPTIPSPRFLAASVAFSIAAAGPAAAQPRADAQSDPIPSWTPEAAAPPEAQSRFADPPYLGLAPPPDGWRVDVVAWAWLVGMEGDVGVNGRTADVSGSFCDVLEASDSILALAGRVEVGKGRWGLFVDGMYASLGAEDQSGPAGVANVDVTFDLTVVDFGLTFRLAEWTPRGAAARNRRRPAVDLYAGGRYAAVDVELDPRNFDARARSEDWIDPIVGARLFLPLTRRWHVTANADYGGFGIQSDSTWSATAVVGLDFKLFNLPSTLYAGYRAISHDFSDGSGPDEFTWDTTLHGPILGLGIRL